MIGFGLVTEGISDQIVIKNILYGLFNSKDIPTPELSPRIDETDADYMIENTNWLTVLEYCQTEVFRGFLEKTEDYAIIQIDTDALTGDSVPEKYRIDIIGKSVEDTVAIVQNKLISLIGTDFYKSYQEKIIFAISVNSIECWLLPFYFSSQKVKAGKTENCITVLNEGLKKGGHKFYIHAKDPRYYRIAAEPMKKHKDFIKYYSLNPSLKLFVDDMQARRIEVDN